MNAAFVLFPSSWTTSTTTSTTSTTAPPQPIMTLKQVLALDMELPAGSTTSSLNANTDFVQGLRAALAKMYADPSVEVTHVQNLSVEVKGGRRRELLVRQTAGLLGQEALGLGQKTSA